MGYDCVHTVSHGHVDGKGLAMLVQELAIDRLTPPDRHC